MQEKAFRGEVWNNIDPVVLERIVQINTEPVDGKVGQDSYTAKADRYLQSFFEQEIGVLYTINGTAANVVALKGMLDRFGSVVCAQQAHINTHECGAVEYNLGNKILPIPTADGKLTPIMVEEMLRQRAGEQYCPQVLAITQPTELGALYTVEEIRALAEYAHGKGMQLFIDGARLGAALAALGVSIREMLAETGVDVFTVGGTKAGAMFGEAVVFSHKAQLKQGDYILKQSMQHFDKSKFLGAQMLALFENDRWIRNFDHANKMAKRLGELLTEKGIPLYLPVESNMVFCVLEEEQLEKMCACYDLKYWFQEQKVVRIATTFATEEAEIMQLVNCI